MFSITNVLRTLPSSQFKRSRSFYMQYDGFYLLLCAFIAGGLVVFDFQPWVTKWSTACWIALPLVIYMHILCSVFIHNASHVSFPLGINRIVGEICGLIVLARFASWQIVHQRHHKYSDDIDNDPHAIAPGHEGYWKHLLYSLANVEKMLQQTFLEMHGDTPENRRYERRRAWISYGTNIALILCWYFFLGPIAFFGLFVPASVIGVLFVSHFNWATHNGGTKGGEYKPVNLDEGYFWWGNRFFFGIYMHANHHRWARLFNPLRIDKLPPRARERAIAELTTATST